VVTPELGVGSTSDDTALGMRIRHGDPAAENEVVGRYSARVFSMVMARIRDREAARELVDDVMMATVMALRQGTVHDTARLGAFIHGTALNIVHNHVRLCSRTPRGVATGEEPTTPDLAESCERDSDIQQVRGCVQRLAQQDQQVLFMSLSEGLKPGEIAARLGLSAEVVRQQKSRALKRLKEMLDGQSRNALPEPHSNR